MGATIGPERNEEAFRTLFVIVIGLAIALVLLPTALGMALSSPAWGGSPGLAGGSGGGSSKSTEGLAAAPPTLDSAGGTVVATVQVGHYPEGLAYDTSNGYVYVTNFGSDSVSLINETTVVATVSVGFKPAGVAYDSGNGYVYVANFESANVSVINGTTVVATIPITSGSGIVGVAGVAYDSGNGYVYVANSLEICNPVCGPGNVSVINGTTVVATIPVGNGPGGVAYDSGNGYVYVTNEYSNSLSVINGTTVVATLSVGHDPASVAYDSGNGFVYVTNYYSNNVSVINGTTVVATIPVGNGPAGVAYDNGNGYVYVANGESASVSVINGTTVVATIPVGNGPAGVAYDNGNGYVYVADWRSDTVSVISTTAPLFAVSFTERGLPSGTSWAVALDGLNISSSTAAITFFEPNGIHSYVVGSVSGYASSPSSGSITVNRVPKSVTVSFTASSAGGTVEATVQVGTHPVGVAYDRGNGYVYVANFDSANVSVIDGTAVIATIALGSVLIGPAAAAYDSENGFVYVANHISYTVSVINGTTVVATIPVDCCPSAVAYDSGNGYVYVANAADTISVINGTTVIATIPEGRRPLGLAYDSANGDVYVANWISNTIGVIKGTSVVATIPVGSGPRSVEYDGGNGYVYVTNEWSDTVSVINGTTVVGTIPVGMWPNGVASDGRNTYVYVANYGSNTVSVINGMTVVGTVPVGNGPGGVAYDSGNGYVYVTNEWSNTVSVIPTTTPPPPEGLVATPGDGHVSLEWNSPASSGGSPIIGYSIYRGSLPGGEVPIVTVGDIHAYTDTGLANGVAYFYQVSAVNAFGEGRMSNEAHATPGTPTAPLGLQAAPKSAGIDLTWQRPTSQGSGPITGYRIYRGTFSGGETFLADVGNFLQYSDSNVSSDTAYFYQLTAVNAFGEGPLAPEVSATPESGPGPGNAPFPWTTTAVAAGLLLASAGAAASLLHTRILREEVLQRKVRMLIFEYTRANPGASFSRIRDAAGLKNGVAAYHLRVLEKQGLVHSESRQRHRWYYPNGDVSMWRDIPLSSLQSALLNEVRHAPGLGIRDLARAVDRRPSSVAYNVKGLVREKMLRTERVGAKLCCFLGTADSL